MSRSFNTALFCCTFVRTRDWRNGDALDLGLIPPPEPFLSDNDRHSSHFRLLTHCHKERFCPPLAMRTVQVRSKEGRQCETLISKLFSAGVGRFENPSQAESGKKR